MSRPIESILSYIDREDTIEGANDLEARASARVRLCVHGPHGMRSIAWQAHITMMAAAQLFLSGAISKTVNMPRNTTPEEIAEVYIDGWKLGLKALAIYRDGSKESQPLNTSTEADKQKDKEAAPRREASPQAAPGYPAVDHPQVQHQRPRRLHHRGVVPRWFGRASCSSPWRRKVRPSAA